MIGVGRSTFKSSSPITSSSLLNVCASAFLFFFSFIFNIKKKVHSFYSKSPEVLGDVNVHWAVKLESVAGKTLTEGR